MKFLFKQWPIVSSLLLLSILANSAFSKLQDQTTHEKKVLGLDGKTIEGDIKWFETSEPKLSPNPIGKSQIEFSFECEVSTLLDPEDDHFTTRFRIYTETKDDQTRVGIPAAFELIRLWMFNRDWLKIDHSPQYNDGTVDLYFSKQGSGGGEQMFTTETTASGQRKVNVIYVFDLSTFTDQLEEAREVAHEYGHAVLPAIGGYAQPEYWANGYLGESLYLKWLNSEIKLSKLDSSSAMGVSEPRLNDWVENHSIAPAIIAGTAGPAKIFAKGSDSDGKSAADMDAYRGLVLYCDSIFSKKMFARSLLLIGSERAEDYVTSAVSAAEESTYSPVFMKRLLHKKIWIPVGNGTVIGSRVYKRSHGWDLILSKQGIIVKAALTS